MLYDNFLFLITTGQGRKLKEPILKNRLFLYVFDLFETKGY
jgi:hypothetical protein